MLAALVFCSTAAANILKSSTALKVTADLLSHKSRKFQLVDLGSSGKRVDKFRPCLWIFESYFVELQFLANAHQSLVHRSNTV